MACRPLFVPQDTHPFVLERSITFDWAPGFSISQKQKSIRSLHQRAVDGDACQHPLEVSTKSSLDIGVQMSAFNLSVERESGSSIAVENMFQAAKKFSLGGPFKELRDVSPKEARQQLRDADKRLGPLETFVHNGKEWPLEPKTLFYDWIYLNTLYRNQELAQRCAEFDGFTDIEFNPNRSFNCQARSAALFLGLARAKILDEVMSSEDAYRSLFSFSSSAPIRQETLGLE